MLTGLLLCLLPHRAQDHLPRAGAAFSRLCPPARIIKMISTDTPTDKSELGITSTEVFLSENSRLCPVTMEAD